MLWLPRLDPRVVRLVADGAGSQGSTLAGASVQFDQVAEDGRHLLIGPPSAPSTAVAPAGLMACAPLAAMVPLDLDTPLRVEAVLKLWRSLTGRPEGRRPDALTPMRRERLAQMLRAVDARRAGATRRDIAEVLFGPGRVPAGVEFDDHALRSRAARLIREGLAMIDGGYRKLLRR